MAKKTVLENFLKMTPQVPAYGARNQHFLIAGADPLYYLGQSGTQEQQTGPLAAAYDFALVPSSALDGNIVHTVASTNPTFSVYFITDTTRVYGATTAGIVDMGYPTGSSVSNAGGRLACMNSEIFAVFSFGTGSDQVYKMTAPGPGAWTMCATTVQNLSGVHFMEPFLDYVAIADSDAPSITNHLVKKLSVTAFTIDTGIDIGAGWGVMSMNNFNNKYLAIAAGQTVPGGGANGYVQNYIFLWDGISDRYNYSVKVPGQFIDMRVIDSVLYVAVQISTTRTALYQMAGTRLKKVSSTQISNIATITYSPSPSSLFSFRNYVGMKLQNTTTQNGSLVSPLLAQGADESGPFEYVFASGRIFDQICVGYDGSIFASQYFASGNSKLWFKTESGTAITDIFYLSQWIPVADLQSLDIYYDEPPVLSTDKISVTIYGRGEDISQGGGNSTTALTDITTTTRLTQKRTRLDVKGFTGDFLKVQLTTTRDPASTWVPIIRAIVPITEE